MRETTPPAAEDATSDAGLLRRFVRASDQDAFVARGGVTCGKVHMAKKRKKDCLGMDNHGLTELLKRFGCRLVNQAEIAARIEDVRRGRDWSGIAQFLKEDGPKWVNDTATLVFEIPFAKLAGGLGLYFAQEVWMAQPSLFEFLELDDQGVVRLWWDADQGAAPYVRARGTPAKPEA